MSDFEIILTLGSWAIGAMLFGATVGWYLFLRLFKLVDDYLHS